jgi:hypothetical protein
VATAATLGVLQLVVAATMVLGHLPPVLRSLHEATGVSIWIAAFAMAYLSRIGSGSSDAALLLPTAGRDGNRSADSRGSAEERPRATPGLAAQMGGGE